MSFDVFAAIRFGAGLYAVHNVKLVDVQPTDHGYTSLIVEHAGVEDALTSDVAFRDRSC